MKNFMRSLYEAIYRSNKAKAEIETAKQLWLTEYKHESYDYILTMVRAGRAFELGSRDYI